VWVHVQAIHGEMPISWMWGLHAGIFVVFFPAVVVAQKRVGPVSRNDYWKRVLDGAPEWMKYLLYGLFPYAIVNFFWCSSKIPTGHHHAQTTPLEWRMFSGHWMAFYYVAFAILYAAIAKQPFGASGMLTAAPAGGHCANGHRIGNGDSYCAICGGARAY
jgi:hypothetical protein